jgi:hypothetical protein
LWLTRTTSVGRSLSSQGGGRSRFGPLMRPSKVRSLYKGRRERQSSSRANGSCGPKLRPGYAREDRVGKDAEASHLHIGRRLTNLSRAAVESQRDETRFKTPRPSTNPCEAQALLDPTQDRPVGRHDLGQLFEQVDRRVFGRQDRCERRENELPEEPLVDAWS